MLIPPISSSSFAKTCHVGKATELWTAGHLQEGPTDQQFTQKPQGASQAGSVVKNPPTMQEMQVWSLGWEDPLKKKTATHSNIHGLGNPKARGV